MFELGVKLFNLGIKSFGLEVKPASGHADRTFFVVYTDEEKVYLRKDTPMTAFVLIRADTQPNCTEVG